MKKSYIVDSSYEGTRIDKWIRNFLGKVPQGLIEKSLRIGKIKLNNKKIKGSTKLNFKDVINVYDIKFEENSLKNKSKFNPSNEIIKENEDLIIDDNKDFIVVNKESGIAVQGGTKCHLPCTWVLIWVGFPRIFYLVGALRVFKVLEEITIRRYNHGSCTVLKSISISFH